MVEFLRNLIAFMGFLFFWAILAFVFSAFAEEFLEKLAGQIVLGISVVFLVMVALGFLLSPFVKD